MSVAMTITTTALWSKLEEMGKQFGHLDGALLQRLGSILEAQENWKLFRINPLHFAQEHQFDPNLLIQLFIFGTKVGLFELDWNLICPMCGCVEHTYNSLDQIAMGDTFFCTLCEEEIETELDNYVEVSFDLHPSIRELGIDPYASRESYMRYFFSSNFIRPQAMIDYIERDSIRDFIVIPPLETGVAQWVAQPGEEYRLLSLDRHSVTTLRFTEAAEPAMPTQRIEITSSLKGFAPTVLELPAGSVEIAVTNVEPTRTAFALMQTDWEHLYALHMTEVGCPYLTVRPFLSGKMLLNNQKFRESFLVENLPNGMNLKISNLTVLFTDLKGSTSLYEKTGDVTAYRLVQDHFRLLTDVVSRHAGATVKTMGDAIMASFSTPADGLGAALTMVEEMKRYNDGIQNQEAVLELKIGLHTGPALAVKANETIDFFGQTVNLAARVQGQAQAGEVWISDAIRQDPSASAVLEEYGYQVEPHSVLLKGVNAPSLVYRCATA